MMIRPTKAGLAIVALAMAFASDGVARPDQVVEKVTGAGTYLMTSSDQSLYWYERDLTGNGIACVEACLENWVPLSAENDVGADALWTIIERPDESRQWAYDGKPLYTFVGDTFPGAKLGDGAGRGSWRVLFEMNAVPPGMKIEQTLLGFVLADHTGQTLYVRNTTQSAGDESAPINERRWQPFNAPWLAKNQGDWTIVTSDSGVRQWAYKGKELFTYNNDIDPYDVHGHGEDGIWSAVILEKAPELPKWMTIQWIDLGLAYADADGMTLYAAVDIDVIKTAQTCPEDCMRHNWRPVLAEPGETSVGDWVIRENESGARQWSYKGRLLYTHTRDEKPGDMKGNGIAVGYRIGDGWRIIPVEAGFRRSRT